MNSSSQGKYAHPEVLVTAEWVQEHHLDRDVRVVEVDYDPATNYNQGHIPGSVLFDWRKDLNDPTKRDILSKEKLEELLGRNGVSNDTWIILYGDYNNWFAAYAFWDLRYYGVSMVKLMNGGRKKWLLEDRPLTQDVPNYRSTVFKAGSPDEGTRAYKDYVKETLGSEATILVDVRDPEEFTGEILAPSEYPTEHAQRGGHIPGAVNIPWDQAINDADGTFKPRTDLEALYTTKGVLPQKEVIVYCRIGERSSHTWFVLKHLLGFPNIRNYDGSWTEWGNSVRLPIEK